jgi:hypothetical protein
MLFLNYIKLWKNLCTTLRSCGSQTISRLLINYVESLRTADLHLCAGILTLVSYVFTALAVPPAVVLQGSSFKHIKHGREVI